MLILAVSLALLVVPYVLFKLGSLTMQLTELVWTVFQERAARQTADSDLEARVERLERYFENLQGDSR